MKLSPQETIILSPALALLMGYYNGHLKVVPASPEHEEYMELLERTLTKINIEIEGDISHLENLADKLTNANLSR